MQKRTDILVIGSRPEGVVGAITAKQFHPDKNDIYNYEKLILGLDLLPLFHYSRAKNETTCCY